MSRAFLLLLQLFLVAAIATTSATISCSAFSFLSVGDWGSHEFARVADNFNFRAFDVPFALLVGDNFYGSGVKSTSDPQWQSTYQTLLSGRNLAKTAFFVTAGNHDYYGNATAQVDYQDPTGRWTFPALYYDRFEEHDGVKLHLVMLDTWRINGGDTVVKHSPATNKASLRSLRALDEADGLSPETKRELLERFGGGRDLQDDDDNDVEEGDQEQLDWLRQVLSSNASRACHWRIVVGHYPIHSALARGHGDTVSLQAKLRPLLIELDVDAYVSGHDHILQIINVPGERLVHYGVGAGARTSNALNAGYPGLLTAMPNSLGFMKHSLTQDTMTTMLYHERSYETGRIVQAKRASGRHAVYSPGLRTLPIASLWSTNGGGGSAQSSFSAAAGALLLLLLSMMYREIESMV